MSADANRLSDDDRARVRRAVGSLYAKWAASSLGGIGTASRVAAVSRRPENAETARRVAYGSIGCVAADLRESELEEIDGILADVRDDPRCWRFS